MSIGGFWALEFQFLIDSLVATSTTWTNHVTSYITAVGFRYDTPHLLRDSRDALRMKLLDPESASRESQNDSSEWDYFCTGCFGEVELREVEGSPSGLELEHVNKTIDCRPFNYERDGTSLHYPNTFFVWECMKTRDPNDVLSEIRRIRAVLEEYEVQHFRGISSLGVLIGHYFRCNAKALDSIFVTPFSQSQSLNVLIRELKDHSIDKSIGDDHVFIGPASDGKLITPTEVCVYLSHTPTDREVSASFICETHDEAKRILSFATNPGYSAAIIGSLHVNDSRDNFFASIQTSGTQSIFCFDDD